MLFSLLLCILKFQNSILKHLCNRVQFECMCKIYMLIAIENISVYQIFDFLFSFRPTCLSSLVRIVATHTNKYKKNGKNKQKENNKASSMIHTHSNLFHIWKKI